MNKITNKRFQETYYEETLDNGLHVVLWTKKDYVKSFFMMATPLGALDVNQVDDAGKEYSFNSGIAHFLEHKMFEKKEQDVMEEFTQLGASCNAFTSYSETAYYFSTSENVQQPLHLLLDFVQALDITKESVEKEKGIIIQELDMYDQMSDFKLINQTMEALYENHPLKYDIGGTHESVNATSKEELELCYRLNYHPSKMILVGVSGEDPTQLMNIIKENQSGKTFPDVSRVSRKAVVEPLRVHAKKASINMDISTPKVNVSFKCQGIQNVEERNKKEWCFKLLFDMYFSTLNEQFQQWIDEEVINNSFSFEIDFGEDYGILMFYSETQKSDAFVALVLQTLKDIKTVDEARLEQLKKRYFGVSVNALTSGKQIAITFMRNYFSGLDFFASLEAIERITAQDVLHALADVDIDNYTNVSIEPIQK